ncbi:hypothetical protein RFI_24450 [Reticulomyxa filosa]|uniref:Sema domain-containing protein n=1 Tax=Reticulomyxa filosa TaxID=46433 RepID=X6MIQ4_RETFI|nr:hypothetical protein RFI_24450 [Reticulomyxa filosa]|eukprot:ETO12925.1 hypothetical protein RFI_24450 [Reticulomyxa filosa]
MIDSQCVAFDAEVLICGSISTGDCYSYHVVKEEYKKTAEYPWNVELQGHSVIKCDVEAGTGEDKNIVTLLSFGGSPYHGRHTLMMRYQSVWSGESSKKVENRWLPLANGEIIGRDNDDLQGARALISGTNKDLLFVTHNRCHIKVIDMKSYRYISDVQNAVLPVSNENRASFHCFVLLKTNTFVLISEDESFLSNTTNIKRTLY